MALQHEGGAKGHGKGDQNAEGAKGCAKGGHGEDRYEQKDAVGYKGKGKGKGGGYNGKGKGGGYKDVEGKGEGGGYKDSKGGGKGVRGRGWERFWATQNHCNHRHKECYALPHTDQSSNAILCYHFWVSGKLSRAQSLVYFV